MVSLCRSKLPDKLSRLQAQILDTQSLKCNVQTSVLGLFEAKWLSEDQMGHSSPSAAKGKCALQRSQRLSAGCGILMSWALSYSMVNRESIPHPPYQICKSADLMKTFCSTCISIKLAADSLSIQELVIDSMTWTSCAWCFQTMSNTPLQR